MKAADLVAICDQRWMTPPGVDIRTLKRMASLGLATQCGRLFHPTTYADQVVAELRRPSPQAELFADQAIAA